MEDERSVIIRVVTDGAIIVVRPFYEVNADRPSSRDGRVYDRRHRMQMEASHSSFSYEFDGNGTYLLYPMAAADVDLSRCHYGIHLFIPKVPTFYEDRNKLTLYVDMFHFRCTQNPTDNNDIKLRVFLTC